MAAVASSVRPPCTVVTATSQRFEPFTSRVSGHTPESNTRTNVSFANRSAYAACAASGVMARSSGAIAVTVGTGDARIQTKLADAGAIKGKTGVGSVEMTGIKGTVKSSTVGGSVTGQGQGKQPIEATVGVGDLSLTLIE